MKKIVILLVMSVLILSGIFAENPASGTSKKVLLIFEESNENTDPWLARLRAAFASNNIQFDEKSAAQMSGTEMSSYDLIYIYGTVMAFTGKEPIRDWLKTGPAVDGRKIFLFITANRWFVDKYTGQLTDLLEDGNADIVDTVSAATKELTDEEKDRIIALQMGDIKKAY